MTLRSLLFATTAIAALALAPAASAGDAPLKVKSVAFTSTPAPSNALEMATGYTRSEAIVTLADGTQQTYPLQYRVLHRSDDSVPGRGSGRAASSFGRPATLPREARPSAAGGSATPLIRSPMLWAPRAEDWRMGYAPNTCLDLYRRG